MTTISRQILEEAREFAFKSCPYHYSDCEIEHCNSNCQWHRYSQQDDSYKKFKQGAEFVLNLNRWRKVSEELPSVDNYVLIGNPKSSYYYIAKWYSKQNRFVDTRGRTIYYSEKLEWKPID